ncbi:MAG: hypothetical protein M5R42_05395 [Rhodocyclaceae bacterium]|nr:hypothetical protein [Rhodocyclaceae bacterium]
MQNFGFLPVQACHVAICRACPYLADHAVGAALALAHGDLQRTALPSRWLLNFLVAAGSRIFLTFNQFFGKDPGIALLICFRPSPRCAACAMAR